MRGLETASPDTLDDRFRRAVAGWCDSEGMSARMFGIAALGDANFVNTLLRGRSPRLATVDRVLAFIGEPAAGPAFLDEVEAFLTVTGIKRSVLGRAATGNPSFVAQLRQGMSPTLSTVDRVRGWMASHATAAEAREVRERACPMPAVLAGAAAPGRLPPRQAPRASRADDHASPEPAAARMYMNTRDAADWLGLSPRTLDRYRVTGEGPAFFRLGRLVRYRREDIETWLADRRRFSTSDSGVARSAAGRV